MSGIPSIEELGYGGAKISDTENSRCRVSTDGGIGYFFASQDAPIMAVMPEPKEGYNSVMGSVEEYADLFRFLSDKDVLRLFLYICTRPQSLFSKRLAAQSMGIPEKRVAQVFDEFEKREWLVKENADMDEGTVVLYRPAYKEYFVFFLFFAREMTISSQFWYLSNISRRKAPLFKEMPE